MDKKYMINENTGLKIEDLRGLTFANLTVMELDLHKSNKGKFKKIYWKCRCKCGNEVVVPKDALSSGHIKSCGCSKKEAGLNKIKDISGKKYGKLTVCNLEYIKKGKGAYWNCLCECGNYKIVSRSQLVSNKTRSCGCLKAESHKKRIKDITGMRFGMLVVEEFLYTKKAKSYWRCKCDCGGVKVADSGHLMQGCYNSCGCLHVENMRQSKFKDLTNKRFGKLTALEVVFKKSTKGNNLTYWKCKCDCGSYVEVYTSSLTSGNTQSCGCTTIERIKAINDKDLVGKNFGMLKVIKFNGYKKCKNNRVKTWLCRCECGNDTISDTSTLNSGKKISCGKCLVGEKSPKWKGGLSELGRHMRRKCNQWYKDTLINDNYTCQITGIRGGDLEVHHIHQFKDILNEALANTNLPVLNPIGKYNSEELKSLENEVIRLHYKYGLGITLKPDIHRLFHSLYTNNSKPSDFIEFKTRYLNGEI